MWFRVKEKDVLLEGVYIDIEPALFGKGKYIISCRTARGDIATTLCTYDSIEEAKIAFEDIQNSIAEGKNLYIMP